MRFLIKDESYKLRQEEFLAPSGEDRFLAFLNLSRRENQLFTFEERTKGNFILKRK